MSEVRVWISTEASSSGAIGVLECEGGAGADLEGLCARVGVPLGPIGSVRYGTLAEIDRGLVVRWGARRASLMVHGAPVVVRAVLDALLDAGALSASVSAEARYPEALGEARARALGGLALASSPLAMGVLLRQGALWMDGSAPMLDREGQRVLGRLLRPPVVACVGRANVGKSSLLNALAGRSVALVSSDPGTTRDGVGALIDLGGLVVRWFDTPGERTTPDGVEREAFARASAIVDEAALVLVCGDAASGWPDREPGSGRVLRCATRSDLGVLGGAACVTSSVTGEGLDVLAMGVRERLVPSEVLERAMRERWVFDPSLAPEGAPG